MTLQTLGVYPEFPLELARIATVIASDPVADSVYRSRLLVPQRPRTVHLAWSVMRLRDAALLIAIFDACKGQAMPFLWQCPRDPGVLRWQFLTDRLPLRRISATCYQTSSPIPVGEALNADE